VNNNASFSRKAKFQTRLKGEHPRANLSDSYFPGSKTPNNEPNGGNDEEDSLLTPTNRAKGQQVLELEKAFNANALLNEPAVYAIRCKQNNVHYIGETQNLKNRIPKHKTQLKEKKTNQKFLADFERFGSSEFELIVVKSGPSMEIFNVRLDLQARLQSLLISLDLCYNTGLSETLTPRPSGAFKSAPGIYCIRCKENNACYFGETAQRTGLNGRLSKWKHNLQKGQALNQKLQADWNLYGENAFEFLVIESGTNWVSQEKRQERESQLINQHHDAGGIVYNFFENRYAPRCHLAAKEQIIYNQSPEFRAYISSLNTGRVNANRIAVFAEGNVYLSYQEAAKCLSTTPRSIKTRVAKGKYLVATEQQVINEQERRTRESSGPVVLTESVSKRTSGKGSPVIVNGITYPSISAAAKAANISASAMKKRIKNQTPGHFMQKDL
jgi:group I intron endonuclease